MPSRALLPNHERRYRSVGQLIDDIERFQNRLPVLARPDSWFYRARKFVARHRVGVAAAGGIAALLIAYAVTVTFQSQRLEEERDRTRLEAATATQVKDFLLRVVTAANPALSELPRPTATDLLEETVRAVRASTSLDPLVRAELLSAMGETFRKLDRYDEARAAFADAAALRAAHLPPGHPDRTLEEFERGLMAWELGASTEARQLFESVIERRRRALRGSDDLLTIRASGLLATVLYDQGHYEQAIATMRDAIARRERIPVEGLPYPPRQWANLGYMLSGQGDLAAGEAALRRSIALARAGGAPFHTFSGLYSNLAATLSLAGRHDEARRAVERAIGIRLRFHPVEHSASTQLLLRRLEILAAGGWTAEAAAGLAELEEILSGVEGGSSRHLNRILRLRARIAALDGDSATAEAILRELVARAPPPGRAARAYARDCLDLAGLLLRRGDPEAARWLHRADRLLRAHALPSHPDRVLVTRLLSEDLRDGKDSAGARIADSLR